MTGNNESFGGEAPRDVERVPVVREEIVALFRGTRQTDTPEVDAVVIGCPFLTLQKLLDLAHRLEGRKEKKHLWLYTDDVVYSAAKKTGILAAVEASGARVVHSCCPGMVDRETGTAGELIHATNSLKVVPLMSGIGWPRNWLGTREDVLNPALTGRFEPTRWL